MAQKRHPLEDFHKLYSDDSINAASYTYNRIPSLKNCKIELEKIKNVYLPNKKDELTKHIKHYLSREIALTDTNPHSNILRLYEMLAKMCIYEQLDYEIITMINMNILYDGNLEKISPITKIELLLCNIIIGKDTEIIYDITINLIIQHEIYNGLPADYTFWNYIMNDVNSKRPIFGNPENEKNWFLSHMLHLNDVPNDIKYLLLLSQCSWAQILYYDMTGKIKYNELAFNFEQIKSNIKYCRACGIIPKFKNLLSDFVDKKHQTYDDYYTVMCNDLYKQKNIPMDAIYL